jgi:hypothetical protein
MINFIKKVYQCEKESSAIAIVNALFWAMLLIASSWLMRGSEHADAFFIIILCGATSAMLFIDKMRKID